MRNVLIFLCPHLGKVRGLARLVLSDLVHRVLGALLGLAEGSPLLRYVHHLTRFKRQHRRRGSAQRTLGVRQLLEFKGQMSQHISSRALRTPCRRRSYRITVTR